jgi:outer membrane biosynthesis protein TonB
MPGGRSSKSKADKNDSTKGQPLPNFRGKLKQMDAKTITLALDDDRQIQFKRNDKTKFFKGGDEIKDPKFAEGDQISIEGPEDATGNMVAVNVYWEKGVAGATKTAAKKDEADPGVDAWKDAPPPNQPATERATEVAPPPSRDPEDPGRPKLQRGRPADSAREHAQEPPPVQQAEARLPAPAPVAAPAAAAPGEIRNSDEDAAPRSIPRHGDDLIRRATDAALEFTEGLPNYVCTEMITRYQSGATKGSWQPLDVVSADVVYENHKESYKNLKRNGKSLDKKMEEMDGAWSTGEFGTVLIDLFSPATAADFHYKKDSRVGGVNAKMYDFNVEHKNSHWDIKVAAQSYTPAFKGSIWIDPSTARVMRIEMQAYGFPEDFPDDHVEAATDYEYTRLGDAKQYLLPVHSENLACQRGTSMCSRNVIDFRNYHKYSGESTITFGKDK